MPFIKPERRNIIDEHGIEGLADIEPGDRCYVHYKRMMDAWRRAPRWGTAHRLMKETLGAIDKDKEESAARFLAWQVFFALHVVPYEIRKEEENGDI